MFRIQISALRPVAVVGGGLGGLTTAAALIKKGIPVQVFERDERNARPQGYGLGLREHGWAALKAIGADTDTLRMSATSLTKFDLTNTNRSLLLSLRIPPGSAMESLSVSRPALHSSLKQLIPDHIIKYGKQIDHYSVQEDGGIMLHFTDKSSVECSLLIAADGTRSVIRRQLLSGDAGQRDFAGYAQVGARIPTKALESLLCDSGSISEMVLSREGCSLFFMPLGNGDEHIWALIIRCDSTLLSSLNSMSQEQLKAFAVEHVKHWRHPLREVILKHSFEHPIHVTGYYYHAPQKLLPLQKQPACRIVLIGDAAHSMTPLQGEGGNTALEDGVSVANAIGDALASSEGITNETIRKLQKEIHDRCAPRVTRSQHAASMFTLRSYWMCVLRDWILWFFYVSWLKRRETKK